ncbi:hypothetical protein SLEP1_g49181 [Rubroshorea leprosula]|uniref:RNase H type-1 domain-containing protein n=1 Tax=Rubroshorea leprosula TaxID=152421 RepID=A0AAV5LZ91_9ROSI|nr:hypothetical protein SLEP1_g49181 [Rubroshorea leprosula]
MSSCPQVLPIWNYFFRDDFQLPQNDTSFFEWIQRNYTKKSYSLTIPAPWGSLFCFVLWTIWIHRNKKVYCDQDFDPNVICRFIRERIFELLSVLPSPKFGSHSSTQKLVKWDNPSASSFKLNTDGSVINNPSLATSGGLIRDHRGHWIRGFSRKIGIASSLVAKIWGIRDGLLLAKQLDIQSLVVEVDSFIAFQLLSTGTDHHPLCSFISDCRALVVDCNMFTERAICVLIILLLWLIPSKKILLF